MASPNVLGNVTDANMNGSSEPKKNRSSVQPAILLTGIDHGKTKRSIKRLLVVVAIALPLAAAEPSTESRTVLVHKQDIVAISTAFHYQTMIQLPEKEQIMSVACGDSGLWQVDYQGNVVFVKPSGDKPGRSTNLNLITASGNTYSLIVREVSTDPNMRADLKVFLNQSEPGAVQAMDHPQFVRATEVDALKTQVAEEKRLAAETAAVAAVKEQQNIKHDYAWKSDKTSERFGLRSIYHDDRFTYIEAHTQEAPALYEIRDGKETIIEYKLDHGVYVVPKILDEGYLRLGKDKLTFTRQQS